MIEDCYYRSFVQAGLFAGAVCIGLTGSTAGAQTAALATTDAISHSLSPSLSPSVAPMVATLEIPTRIPGDIPAEIIPSPIAEDIYAGAVSTLFASGKAGVPEAVEHAYRSNAMKPLWLDQDGATPGVAILSEFFARADEHGLNPAHYSLPGELTASPIADPHQAALIDLALSRTLLSYLSDIRLGVLRPGIRDKNTVLVPKVIDMQALFAAVVADPETGLASAPPPTERYRNLTRLLVLARADMARGAWGNVSSKGRSLRPGHKDRRVPQIAARLTASGEYDVIADYGDTAPVYAPELVDAVKGFQARHGLGVDGIAGRRTVTAMNVTPTQRVEQVIANLERERWQPEDMPARLVEVNVPAYHLVARDGGVPVIDMDVIVGRTRRPTPIFADTIRFVEFNPTWTVPKKLAAEDIGPAVMKDPDYLSRKGFTIYSSWKRGATVVDPSTIDWSTYNKFNIPFRLVQAPGKKNALGSVKFLFPNKFAVYLHDTPGKNLFRKAIRAISSGCIRVKNPRGFAKYLLSGQLDEPQIGRAFSRKRTKRVTLNAPVAVRLVYQTAWLSEAGEAHYRADIYKRDKRLIKRLRAKGLPL